MSTLYTLHVPASDQSRTHTGQNIFVFLSSFSSPGLGVSLQAWPGADQWPYYEQHFNDFSRKHLFCPSRHDISTYRRYFAMMKVTHLWENGSQYLLMRLRSGIVTSMVPSIVRVQAVTVTRPRPSLTPDSTLAYSCMRSRESAVARICHRLLQCGGALTLSTALVPPL